VVEVPALDSWAALRAATPARIGLGRSGDALPVRDVLDFQLAHAKARDAVHRPLDAGAILEAVPGSLLVRSAVSDRMAYLRRPDLGRRLHEDCRADLVRHGAPGGYDAVFVIADGLSPVGVQRHAVPLLQACLARLPGWSVAPAVIAVQARVALGDEVGELLGARLVAVLIGERPGLSVADSLGAYVTHAPQVGRRDSERNCVSNIHPGGLSYDAAADMLAWLMTEARSRKLTGVALKDDRAIGASPMRLDAP
jgi:ethanolamine ammonia-lyase small subunit